MSMADKIVANAAPHLEPGEHVQGAFAVQKTLTNKAGNGGYRAVVATDQRFLVFQSGTFSQTTLKKLLASLPRDQRLGPGRHRRSPRPNVRLVARQTTPGSAS